jgi:hypothetical protein
VQKKLVRDHGAVEDLDQANLNYRALSGNGCVVFEAGGARNLTYTCNFDRGGKIHDCNYSYRGSRLDIPLKFSNSFPGHLFS